MRLHIFIILMMGFLNPEFEGTLFHLVDQNLPEKSATTIQYYEYASLGKGEIADASWDIHNNVLAVSGSQGIWLYRDDFSNDIQLQIQGSSLVAWNSDGTKLAAVKNGNDTSGKIEIDIWDTADEKITNTLSIQDHGDQISSISWSWDNRKLAISGSNNIWIWEVDTGVLLRMLQLPTFVNNIAWSPAVDVLAIAEQNIVQVWDFNTDQYISTLNVEAVNEIAWSPDGSKFATASGTTYPLLSEYNSLQVWNASTSQLLLAIQANLALAVDWSPDGSLLATGNSNDLAHIDTVNIWDAKTGALRAWLVGHSRSIHSVEWSYDGKKVLSVAEDNTAIIWDIDLTKQINEKRQPAVLDNYSGEIRSLAWNPNGIQIASTSSDGAVRIWDSETGAPLTTFRDYSGALSIAWSPDGHYLASGRSDNKVFVTDLSGSNQSFSGQHERPPLGQGIPDGVPAVAWSPDGQFLASGGYDGTVRIWSMDATRIDRLLNTFEGSEAGIRAVAWSPDSNRVAGIGNGLRVWDVTTKELILEYKCFQCLAVSWSPDGKKLAISLERGELGSAIMLIDPTTGESINTWSVVGQRPQGIVWSSDGSKLAAFQPNKFDVWDVNSAEIAATIDQPNISALVWNPDGKSIAVGDSNGVIHIWQES